MAKFIPNQTYRSQSDNQKREVSLHERLAQKERSKERQKQLLRKMKMRLDKVRGKSHA